MAIRGLTNAERRVEKAETKKFEAEATRKQRAYLAVPEGSTAALKRKPAAPDWERAADVHAAADHNRLFPRGK